MTLLALIMIQIYLIILRLTNTVGWSWFVILAPYELVMALVIISLFAKEDKSKDEWEKARAEWRKVSKK